MPPSLSYPSDVYTVVHTKINVKAFLHASGLQHMYLSTTLVLCLATALSLWRLLYNNMHEYSTIIIDDGIN